MGWIKDRNMRTGKGFGGNKRTTDKSTAPLRKIVQVVQVNNMGLFGSDKVLLECGHTTRSNGTYRARCRECKKLNSIPT